MLDINLIRDKPDVVRAAMLHLNAEAPIDSILFLDAARRQTLTEVEALRAERNTVSREIPRTADQGERQAQHLCELHARNAATEAWRPT